MPVDPANAHELVSIAQEVGAVVVDGPLRFPSETGSWQVGGVDLGEFLAQYRGQQVVLIVAPVGEADPDVVLCGVCGFPMNDAGRCPRCALVMRDQAVAIRREIEAERLLDDIERFLTGLDDDV